MKVVEHLLKSRNPLFSYEIVPPPRGRSIQDIVNIVSELAPLNPPFIDVTAHASGAYYQEKEDGSIEKKIYKKRPGTMGICGVIQNRFKIDTVAHILCLGFTREETEDALIELNYLGIHNVLALRGDGTNYKKEIGRNKTINEYALDLVEQVSQMKKGRFLEELDEASPLDFGIGVAGYPEKHFESPNLAMDIQYLKKKVEAGAEYIVTQMFFDNQKYHDFVKACREADINVPIIPGIKVIRSAKQLVNLPKNFYIDLPDNLVNEIHDNPHHVVEIGKEWALHQVEDLLNHNVPCIHFYVMNDTDSVTNIVKRLKR